MHYFQNQKRQERTSPQAGVKTARLVFILLGRDALDVQNTIQVVAEAERESANPIRETLFTAQDVVTCI